MRIVVDTSVWIDFLAGRRLSIRTEMDRLIDEDLIAMAVPVRIEILGGARKNDMAKLGRLFDAIPTFLPTRQTWETVERWAVSAATAGDHFGVGDLLIGALAAGNGAPIWSLDDDFHRMAALGFISVHFPRNVPRPGG